MATGMVMSDAAVAALNVSMEDVAQSVASDIINAFIVTSADARAASTPFLVAIAGIPGSGKTTLAAEVVRLLNASRASFMTTHTDVIRSTASNLMNGSLASDGGDPTSYLQSPPGDVQLGTCFTMGMDGYHLTRKQLDEMEDPAEAHRRRGAHWTFDAAALRRDLDVLKSTGQLRAPAFDHAARDPCPGAIHIDARTLTKPLFSQGSRGTPLGADVFRSIVVVEGLYLCLEDPAIWKSVKSLFDLTVFLKCPLPVATERLVQRHMAAWGISREEALDRASGSDRENALLVDATAVNAHIVVDSVQDADFVAAASAASRETTVNSFQSDRG